MFKKAIVGVDARPGDRDAITLAKDLVADGGEVALAFVYLCDTTPVRGSSGAFEATERQRGLDLLEAARSESQIDAGLLFIGSRSVGRGLHELAELQGADVLVLGSTSHGLIRRVLIGDDTRAALNGAPCAVAIAPTGYSARPGAPTEIGVAYNGSPESEHALAVARELAVQHGARVSAFEAVSLPAYLFGGPAAPVEKSITECVENARERIAALSGVEPHAAYGNPAEELTLYSASLDLLVVGSRSYGPIGRLVHGSVSQQLARTARCPLLVLTRAARAQPTSNGSNTPRESAASA